MKSGSIRVDWSKLEIKWEVILYLGTYPLPQSDLIFRYGGSIYNSPWLNFVFNFIFVHFIYGFFCIGHARNMSLICASH